MTESNGSNQRLLFTYHDGQRERKADPIELMIRMSECDLDFDKMAATAESMQEGDDMAALKELKPIAVEVRKMFDLKEFDSETGEGTTLLETVAVMADFMLFANDLKKMEESNPTLQKLMAMESSFPSNETPTTETTTDSATSPSANFTTTESAPTSDVPSGVS